MNLLGYWGVLKSQWRLVALGIFLSIVLALLALYRVTPHGMSLRSPPVYVAKSTLLVTGGDPQAGVTPEYLAQIYSQLAQGDAVRRLIDPTLQRELAYGVDPVMGTNGTGLPLVSVSAFALKPKESIALANRVGNSLEKYVTTSQRTLPKRQRAELTIIARPERALIFKGKRLTPALMLFVLGITGTVFLAFTRNNLRLARGLNNQADAVEPSYAPAAQVPRQDNTAEVSEQDRRRGEEAVQPFEDVAAARRRRTLGAG